ncbi:molybdate transport system substrate-binding protein [Methanosarcina thermophila]|jgi:molybdate transport system substrate-binding protein|uniref:Molybdate transport system substrate-binding protein n=3 Tax=Methanosarcina thermophila TaxID=2210 RepID=A0A1I6YMY8_METTE|nr:molybdate ABC transporter substrate-binding protein [Methanosarcina thermophila]AKB13970.1 Molybdenum ABC transporter, periplasmic molybdenum-binding protein ModA [Methanosarcina thermophila TM-1]AKB15386.1 Molybdenum ABC transporter, periplasmic molybdenum-binding protein ModA [Methanosarcina thermophila CHTI-55]NLU56031.1 molybdate ABC transporter substrate-binding protein [Methanosarcina thermophila]SFT51581.1 molybdate transport system substrate-binding protein [Methanosarcina thermophil
MRKKLVVLLVLLGVFLAIGCTDNGSETANEDDADTPTSKQESEIIVSAAASLTEAFSDMEPQFEAENPGIDVNFNFGASGNLRKQIEGGAPVDVFASADQKNMDILAEKELIENTTRKDFGQNSLVLIVPASSALNITGIESLTSPDVERIAIGNPETVPVGNYTRTALTEAGIWNQLENKFVLAEDVKAVLTYVERGEVDAGFVYMTDAKTAEPGTIEIVTNVTVSTPISYPIAVVSASDNKEEAQEFVDFVTGEEGQKILENYGFTPVSE